jgi:hypothetical protein
MGRKILFSFLMMALSLLLSFAIGEIGFRFYLFGLGDRFLAPFHDEETRNLMRLAYPIQLDRRFGWIPSPKYNGRRNIFNTRLTVLEDSTRSNGDNGWLPPDCKIVAVGDSFTFGDEVSDDQSWPAHLERILRCRVVNGGVCAYGVDQSYLRALELIETHEPQVLLLSLIYEDIERAGQDIRQGLPKPYFTHEDGRLVLHEIPERVFREARKYTAAKPTLLRRLLRSSYFVTHLIDRFEPRYWLGLANHEVGNDPVNVTCQLLQDLERRATAAQIQLFVVTQYYDQEIIKSNSQMSKLTNCLRNTPVEVIDTFAAIKSREGSLHTLYFGELTHMTGAGNKVIAETIAAALSDAPVLPDRRRLH